MPHDEDAPSTRNPSQEGAETHQRSAEVLHGQDEPENGDEALLERHRQASAEQHGAPPEHDEASTP